MSIKTHFFILFKSPRDSTTITNLAEEIYPGDAIFIMEAYRNATTKRCSYLMINLKQNTRDNCRVVATAKRPR